MKLSGQVAGLETLCAAMVSALMLLPAAGEAPFFPIMPGSRVPNDLAVLKRIKDCGFTVAGFVAPETLDACQRAGLKAIVLDPRSSSYDWMRVDEAAARNQIGGLLSEAGNHPATLGFRLCDEPAASWFPGLAKVVSIFRELAPNQTAWVNLFPDYATNEQLGTTHYAEYLERFITVCRPRILCYDNYSMMSDGTVRANYWTNLEAIREAGKRHGLEFWNVVLSVAHFDYREPSAADLRFQAYTTLACGGRGIVYYTYFAKPVGGYHAAPVDQFGNETPTWHFLQNVNLQIQKLSPTLLQLTSDHVYHTGSVPTGCHGPPAKSLFSAVSGGEFLVGEFTHHDGARYAMIVNKSFTNSRQCAPQFRSAPKRVQHVSPYTGELLPFENEYTWLAPGQGVLLKLENQGGEF